MDFDEAITANQDGRTDVLRAKQTDQRNQFLARFPRNSWPSLTLNDYALNTPDFRNSYSYFLEWGTPNLGSISGGSAHKHIIFKRNNGEWAFPRGYANVEEAWNDLRSGFIRMLGLADRGEWPSMSQVDILRRAHTVRLKSLFLYFPDSVLPIYSQNHLTHFAKEFGLDTTGDTLDINQRILRHLRSYPQLADIDPLEFVGLLYSWSPPAGWHTPKYWKIAPGEGGRLWDECRDGGYICVGWDQVGDLSLFDAEDDFIAAFTERFTADYKGNKSTITRKGRELWRLTEIVEGDRIIANRGTSEVLALGTVTSPAYQWRPERAEYKHTINVDWDLSTGNVIPDPVKTWAVTTIAKVPSTKLDNILGRESSPMPPADDDDSPTISTDDELRYTGWNKILDRKGQVIFYGPPGTGKTRAAEGFASWLLRPESGGPPTQRPTKVTFHASYAYEDFIEGFRPISGEGELKLALRDGIMKQVVAQAHADPDRPHVLIIDEINRADVPRVFGELMTVIELSRRGRAAVTLPTSGEDLSVPTNLIVLGTMNTADQSIRSLDAALRRRFGFIELMPDTDLLSEVTIDDLPLDQFLHDLNATITRIAGRERQIGHSFFLDPDGEPIQSAEAFGDIIRTDIIPLLQEIVYDDYSQLREFLGSGIVDSAHSRLTDIVNDDAQLVAALADNFGLKVQSTTE